MKQKRYGRLAGGLAAVSLTALLGSGVDAHVVLMPDTVQAGHPVRVIVVVAEGCAGSPTTSLRIDIPLEIAFVKPAPKAGWTIELTRERAARPGTNSVRERVSAITWRGGSVPDDHYEEFALLLMPPKATGDFYLPALQTCEKGQTSWKQIPTAQTAAEGIEYPAPVLKVQGQATKH